MKNIAGASGGGEDRRLKKNIEFILVNDGSTDNSLDICNEFKKKDKRFK